MDRRGLRGQRLAALFGVGCLLFNYPLLSFFSIEGAIWGIPILYLYVFTIWIVLIGLMAVVIEYRR